MPPLPSGGRSWTHWSALRADSLHARPWGLTSGLVASQCATPVSATVLAYGMMQPGAVLSGAAFLLIYARWRGVPIVLAGAFT
jgi:cytochrome c biogenesis protein CcdA